MGRRTVKRGKCMNTILENNQEWLMHVTLEQEYQIHFLDIYRDVSTDAHSQGSIR